VALYPDAQALELLFYLALVFSAGLLLYARSCLRWPFGPAWWAFTFPLDALAYAAVRHAQQHPSPAWQAIAAATLCVATLFVAMVLVRTLAAARPRSAASPGA